MSIATSPAVGRMRRLGICSGLALAALVFAGTARDAAAAPVDWQDVLGAGKSPAANKQSPTAKPPVTNTIKALATIGPSRTPAATQTPAASATSAATKAPSPRPASKAPPKRAKPARRPTLRSEFPSAGR